MPKSPKLTNEHMKMLTRTEKIYKEIKEAKKLLKSREKKLKKELKSGIYEKIADSYNNYCDCERISIEEGRIPKKCSCNNKRSNIKFNYKKVELPALEADFRSKKKQLRKDTKHKISMLF